MKDKFIVTAAITGAIHTPSMSPYLPITADEIVEEAGRAGDAGAAVVHIHARDPEEGKPFGTPELFAELLPRIKERTGAVICTTTGGALGQTAEQRVAVVKQFSPELASLNAGSMNFAIFPVLDKMKEFKYEWETEYLEMTEDFIFPNTFKTLKQFSQYFREEGTKPEFEVYDVGMLRNLAFLVEKGYVQKPLYLQFVLGILGGIPASISNLMFLLNTAKEMFGNNFVWSVCAAGKEQFRMCNMALLLGGNTRVGLEDNLYLERGVKAKSNGEQVEKIIRIGRELGLEPATPDEARTILNLKGLDRVKY